MRTHKLKLSLLLGILIMLGGTSLFAQEVTDLPLIHFQIFVSDDAVEPAGAEPIHWFVQGGWVVNAGGEGIVELGDDAYNIMITRLNALKSDPRVEKFEMNTDEHKLVLHLKGMNGPEANTMLEDGVKATANSSH